LQFQLPSNQLLGIVCDLRYHACITRGRIAQETTFISCVLNKSASTEQEKRDIVDTIAGLINMTAPTDPNELVDFLRLNVFAAPFCYKAFDIGGWYWEFDSSVAPRKKSVLM
jgi:hypothetical protein